MKSNIEDNCLVDQFKDSDCIYITIWKEEGTFNLYVNEIIVASSVHDKHSLKREGVRIKKLLTKHNIKVKTNLH